MRKKKQKYTIKDIHHRRPKSLGGSNKPSNLSLVEAQKHRAWHTLFDNKDVPEVIRLINKYWIDPSYHIYYKKIDQENPKQLKLFK
jgi:hypothetical protein